jgi:hypothetical protein
MTVTVYACFVRFNDRLRELLSRRSWLLPLHALALTFLLLGFAVSVSAAPSAPPAAPPKAHAHVYLIRGFLNIFSLGMDEMAAKLQRQGVYVTVHNHMAWPSIASQAAEEYRSGKVRTIILVGHSAGADAVASICGRLGEQGIPVKLAIGLDPGLSRTPASGRVDRYINFYVSTGIGHTIDKSPEFRGHFENVDVAKMPGVGHFNIEKNTAMETIVIRDIDAAL